MRRPAGGGATGCAGAKRSRWSARSSALITTLGKALAEGQALKIPECDALLRIHRSGGGACLGRADQLLRSEAKCPCQPAKAVSAKING